MPLSKTVCGLCLGVLGVVLLFYRPAPLASVLERNALLSLMFYVTLFAASFFLVCYRRAVDLIDPAGKAVLITGCDSGFGHQLAKKLDSLGFQVFAGCLAPDREGAQSLAKACSPSLRLIPLDVTDDWQVQKALQVVKDNCAEDALWAVVNNAGIAAFTEIEWCSVDQFQRILDVNVLGVVRVTKAFLPLLRQSRGRVINVASLAGRFTIPAFAAYSMSKKACIAFSDALRLEMKKFDVSVVTIEPGLYRTPIMQEEGLINMNRKSWAETPSSVKEDYGEEYFAAFLTNMAAQMKRARPNVEEVIAMMVEAVCAVTPRMRYVPYWRSYVRATILSSLPAFMTDKVLQKMSVNVPPSSKTRHSSKSSSTGTPGTPVASVFSDTPPANNTPTATANNGNSAS